MTQTNGSETDESLVSDDIIKLLKDMLKENGIKDFKINIKPGSMKGDNYLGVIAKIEVNGMDNKENQVSLDYIIKSAPKSEGFRNLAPIRLAYEREIYVYNVVLPELMKFQEERKVKSPFKSFAKCLQTSFEDKDEALIMEDMTQYGYIMQNRRLPLSYSHAKLVIQELAKLHAFSFAIRDQKPELMDELLSKMHKNFMEDLDQEGFDKHAEVIYGKARAALDPVKDAEAIKKFNAYTEVIKDEVLYLLSAERSGQYAVIRHADCWTNNMLFAYENEDTPNEPTKLCFLDWQITCIGSPVLDLLYFIFSCTDKKLRDNHYDELLKCYYDKLREFGAELGSDIDKLYPHSVFMDHMQKYGKYGLTIATMLIHLMTSESEEVPDMSEIFEESAKMKENVFTAFAYKSKNQDYYHTRIRDVILDQMNYGYI